MSFFIKEKSKSGRKRKVNTTTTGKHATKSTVSTKHKQNDDDITSDESDGENDANSKGKNLDDYSSSEDEDETADQKRKRLAQEHLEKLKAYISSDEEEEDGDPVARRLKQENLARRGRLHRDVALQYIKPTTEDVTVCRGHQLPVTCIVLTPDGRHIFSGSKDCTIIKWNVETGKKVHVIPRCRKGPLLKTSPGHTTHVLCLAISSDGQYLASGDRTKIINIWNPDTCQLLHSTVSRQHRDAVSALAFRQGTHELFSASFDRTVKLWNVGENGIIYVETLFGHHDIITAIDALAAERCVTSGARDGSVRVWKIIEESQLVFHGHSGSIDCVCYVDDSHFFSGADDGSLALWSTMKKKPLVMVAKAHSGQVCVASQSTDTGTAEMEMDDSSANAEPLSLPSNHGSSLNDNVVLVNGFGDAGCGNHPVLNPDDAAVMKKDNWVTAVAALHNSDLVVSGSKDGFLRFWKCGNEYKSLTHLFALPMVGFVNSLQFSNDGRLLVAGIGHEHKLGRWWNIKSAKNAVCIVRLNKLNVSRKTVV